MVQLSGPQQDVVPYACGILRAYVEQFTDLNDSIEWLPFLYRSEKSMEDFLNSMSVVPDLVAFSSYDWNKNRHAKLAQLIKKKFPSTLTIVGGPSIPKQDPDFFKTYTGFDLFVLGEGEKVFKEVLESLVYSKSIPNHVPGTVWKNEDGKWIKNPAPTLLKGPLEIPSPWLQGYFTNILTELKNSGCTRFGFLETNRGCPYSCTFCDWGGLVSQKIRAFDLDRVKSEIDYLANHVSEIFIMDANFGILARDLEITDYLIEASRRPNSQLKSVQMAYAKNSNDRVVEIASRFEAAGLNEMGITLSYQTLTDRSLKAIRRSNISSEKYIEIASKLRAKNIPFYTDIIIGLPEDSMSDVLETIEKTLQMDPDDIHFHSLALLPNAEMYEKKYREIHGIETEKVIGRDSPFPNETEFKEIVVQTNSLERNERTKLFKLKELLAVFHLGRWTYYLAWYLHREKNVRLVDFYMRMNQWALSLPDSVVNRCLGEYFFNKYNQGYYHFDRGSGELFGIRWQGRYFHKHSFLWLCVSANREKFFSEIRHFMKQFEVDDNAVEDLIRYSDFSIIRYDFDPKNPINQIFEYNWYEYFNNNVALKKCNYSLTYRTAFIGRRKKPIHSRSPESYLNVAGSTSTRYNPIDSFVHSTCDWVLS